MPLTPEQRDQVASELKGFAAELNLSDEQKQKLHQSLTEATEKLQEYKQNNPGVTREDIIKKLADNRAAIRQRVVNFLTPEQLTKWDAAVSKAKEFLGQKIAA
jgi:periplasmic protein CpxP/Spy